MDFRVLGPFEAVDGGALPLGGRRRRTLLARLVLADGPITESRLLADLFDRPQEPSSQRLLRLHLDALTDVLGPGRILETADGIALSLRPGESDAEAFVSDSAAGHEAWRSDDPEGAVSLLRGALERWRGDVLEDLAPLPWLDAIAANLHVERARARSTLADAERALGAAARHERTRGLPAGVVSFLLTDVVDSTRRWEERPIEMDAALVLHDELLERLVATHGGALLKHRGEGDSTFSVFNRASDAISAAAAAQRSLATAAWPADCALTIRAAVHTGEAVERGGDYFGPTVNRAARIRSIAQAGWVTLSQSTADLVRPHLPTGLTLAPLGPQLLRGIKEPEPIFRLVDADAPLAVESLDDDRGTDEWAPAARRVGARSAPFAGRRSELGRIEACLPTDADSPSHTVVLTGDAGIGKTRLALELADVADRAGVVTAYGRCDDEVGLPYQPFVAAFGELVARAPLGLLDSYAREFGGELTRLVPGLARRVSWLPPPQHADAETERHLLFDAAVGFLTHSTRHQPLALVLDDLHWAERQTLRLLRYVLDAAGSLPLLVVLAYRGSEVAPDGSLAELVGLARRNDAATIVELHGLSSDDAVPLVNAVTGRSGADATEIARRVADETDGNPMFTLELLRHLAELHGGVIDGDIGDMSTLRLPDTIRDVVEHRVARLGHEAGRVLYHAAVIGTEFDLDVLASCLDDDVDAVLETLDTARVAHLVDESERAGRFAFTHALVPHALEQSSSATRLERTHLRVAQALDELHGDEEGPYLSELAAHLVAAGASADDIVVRTVAKRAGDLALAQLAPDEAVRWYEVALGRLPEAPDGSDGDRIDLLIALGTAQRQAAIAEHRETLLEAARRARATDDPERLAAAALANARGDRSRAYFVDRDRVATLEAALESLPVTDSPQRARLLAQLAQETIHTPDWHARLARADGALAMARRLGDDSTLTDVLLLRYEATRVPHTLPDRLAETIELVELTDKLGDPLRNAFAHMWRSRAALEAGDVAGLDEHAMQAWALSDRVRNPYLRWNLTSHWTNRAIITGDLDEAERNAFACFAAGEGEPDARAVLATHLLTIRAAQGRLAELIDAARKDVARHPELPALEIALAWMHAQLGDVDEAVPTLDRHLADEFASVLYDNMWMTTMAFAAETAARCGHVPAADHLTVRLAPWHEQIVWSGSVAMGPVSWLLGRLATTLGRVDEALARLAAARATCEQMSAPLWLAHVAVAEVSSFRMAGDPDRAASSESDARALALRHGFAVIERDLQAIDTSRLGGRR